MRQAGSGKAGIARCSRGPARPRPGRAAASLSRRQRSRRSFHSPGISDSTFSRARTSSPRLVSCVASGDSDHGHAAWRSCKKRCNSAGGGAEPAGVAADLVQRRQPVVDVERRVLDTLGRHRGRHLLELADEPPLLLLVRLRRRLRVVQQQHVAHEMEQRRRDGRVAALGLVDGGDDVAAVAVGHAAFRYVRAVNGEIGDDLAQGVAQAVEREVARPAVLLGQAVELEGQHLQFARQRHLEGQRLLLVDRHLRRADRPRPSRR